MDETREAIAVWLWMLNHMRSEKMWETEVADIREAYRTTAKLLTQFETDTCRIAVVKKKAESPLVVPEQCSVNFNIATCPLLKAGFVQEVKNAQ